MAENENKLQDVIYKLDILLKKQENFNNEIAALRDEITVLKAANPQNEEVKPFQFQEPLAEVIPEKVEVKNVIKPSERPQPVLKPIENFKEENAFDYRQKPSDWEKFIGENLINKIGIVITVIGVAIGAKYSIEHELISPLTRIILGYAMGLGLLGFGMKLKSKYENYSAVLVSGSIAILYFITYAAYSFYGLFPQLLTFILMVIFTIFSVIAAINYNKQVIAHIGLVGAYAVPFLLSNGSGNIKVFFSYIAIINIGILFISFKRYWKALLYSSFILTWVIFGAWYGNKFNYQEHFTLSLLALSGFFIIFYCILLVYKLLKSDKYDIDDVILILFNSFLFYGFGYVILSSSPNTASFLGIFTIINAIIHFVVGVILYRSKLVDKNLFYLVAGLVLVFITVTIPVQLDGNWVTIIWAFEAALLFWIGRTKQVSIYEKLSYILMLLAFCSILQDWLMMPSYYGESTTKIIPFFNTNFLTGILFTAAFSFISKLYFKNEEDSNEGNKTNSMISLFISSVLIGVSYWVFRIEISTYWTQLYQDSMISVKQGKELYNEQIYNYDLINIRTIWIINYSLLFFSMLSFLNIKVVKNRKFGLFNLYANLIVLIAFLILGLYVLSNLRESYLNQNLAKYYEIGILNIGLRYICFVFVILILVSSFQLLKREFIQPVTKNVKMTFDIICYSTVLWILSSELITWLDFSNVDASYKLGLSILWGVYALLLISIGIWKKQKHLRISAIVLFGVTLGKLFFYDISQMATISKTIIFVSLGVLLLIISFLYNKYKHIIADETEG